MPATIEWIRPRRWAESVDRRDGEHYLLLFSSSPTDIHSLRVKDLPPPPLPPPFPLPFQAEGSRVVMRTGENGQHTLLLDEPFPKHLLRHELRLVVTTFDGLALDVEWIPRIPPKIDRNVFSYRTQIPPVC